MIKSNIIVIKLENLEELSITIVIQDTKHQKKINQLAKEFKGPLECLGENTEKYITFSVPIQENLITIKQLPKN